MRILLTGGAGFIGSHTFTVLAEMGHEMLVVDNFANAHRGVVPRIQSLTDQKVRLLDCDLRDAALGPALAEFAPEAVVHFAGLKAVGDSVADPLSYYEVNIGASLALLRALKTTPARRFVFSSSATVYGAPQTLPLTEDHPRGPTNPYGRTKAHIEDILFDLAASDPDWSVAVLRYFNPVGAHPSGLIGEDPHGVPNNLMPYIAQVAVGARDTLPIFGDDYETRDGTGARDYLHVMDLARAHGAALDWTADHTGARAFNIGTGADITVKEMIAAFARASGREINARIMPRRAGDIARCYADVSRAAEELEWTARESLDAICADQWRWQSGNPNGYSNGD